MRYAEEANYFTTSIHPAVSQGEVSEMLDNFGATAIMVVSGQAGGVHAWMVRFTWMNRTYRFSFTPLECKYPDKVMSYGKVRRKNRDQSLYQMGRIAVNFVKAILTAAEATPAALFGFLELPGRGNSAFPPTTAQLDVSGLIAALPDLDQVLMIEAGGQQRMDNYG
jgi:hypothetical protein